MEHDAGPARTRVRLYGKRASYHLEAARAVFALAPVAHVAFIHRQTALDSGEASTLLNIPLLTVLLPIEGVGSDAGDLESWAVYFHTYKRASLVEAVRQGTCITATTTIIDGLVFSPTAHDHSLDYRSACLHLTDAHLLDDRSDFDEKVRVLTAVTDTVAGYDRTRVVGRPPKAAVDRTTVVRCRIAAVSCKQRYGGFDGGRPPELQSPDGAEEGWKGVMPCWTQWGDLRGYGKDRDEVEDHQEQRSVAAREFAEAACGGEDAARIEGLGARAS